MKDYVRGPVAGPVIVRPDGTTVVGGPSRGDYVRGPVALPGGIIFRPDGSIGRPGVGSYVAPGREFSNSK